MAKATGNQGNWFAKVDAPRFPNIHGKSLPCVWDYWWTKNARYCDKGYDPTIPQFAQLIEGLRESGHAILRKARLAENGDWKSDGYVAVYEISDVEVGQHLTFKFTKRVCDLD